MCVCVCKNIFLKESIYNSTQSYDCNVDGYDVNVIKCKKIARMREGEREGGGVKRP